MGKKKSNVAKRIQAKASNRSRQGAKFGSVIVTKGGSSAAGISKQNVKKNFFPTTPNKNHPNVSKSLSYKKSQVSITSKNPNSTITSANSKTKKNNPIDVSTLKPNKSQLSKRIMDDHDHISLFERMQQQQQEKQRRSTSSSSFATNMAPVMLLVDDKDKSTHQLVEETTTQWNTSLSWTNPTSSTQSYPTTIQQYPLETKAPWSQPNTESTTWDMSNDNPYAVLYTNEDDDENDNINHKVNIPSFAPPSFTISTSYDERPTWEGDWDPDL
jgi:hypothetical protein